jgi:hypothetical protein
MDGTPILTEMTMETVKSPQQMAQEGRQGNESGGGVTSLGGIGGMLGRKMARKKTEEGGPKNRTTVMTVNQELIKVLPTVAASDVSIPPGFKEKK